MRARLQQTKRSNLILHLSFNQDELNQYQLQTGKQPPTIFTIMVHRRKWAMKRTKETHGISKKPTSTKDKKRETITKSNVWDGDIIPHQKSTSLTNKIFEVC